MANLGSENTPIEGESFGLPSGYSFDEENDDLVIRDTDGTVAMRRADGTWELESDLALNENGISGVGAFDSESVNTESLESERVTAEQTFNTLDGSIADAFEDGVAPRKENIPQEVASSITHPDFDYLRDVFVRNGYAYVTERDNDAFFVVNVSDPQNPGIVSSITDADIADPYSVSVQGNHAIISANNNEALVTVDISNPANPQIEDVLSDSSLLNNPRRQFVRGDYAYITADGSSSLTIVDISDPSNLSIEGSVSDSTLLDRPWAVHVQDNYAYVVGRDLDGMTIVDVSDPSDPFLEGTITDSDDIESPRDIHVRGDYAYVQSRRADALNIIDVSDVSNPTLAGRVSDSVALEGPRGISLRGDYVFVCVSNGDRFAVVDVTDETNPKIINSVTDVPGQINNFVKGDYAYTVGGDTFRTWGPTPYLQRYIQDDTEEDTVRVQFENLSPQVTYAIKFNVDLRDGTPREIKAYYNENDASGNEDYSYVDQSGTKQTEEDYILLFEQSDDRTRVTGSIIVEMNEARRGIRNNLISNRVSQTVEIPQYGSDESFETGTYSLEMDFETGLSSGSEVQLRRIF